MPANPHPAMTPALTGDRHELDGRAGRLSYYRAGTGAPVLLLHSINAAASAFEMRPVFEHLQPRFQVYAPDLPGFGYSDRSKRLYDIELYVHAVNDMLDRIAQDHGEIPVLAFALSLSAEFLARTATQRPARVSKLVLINPTGFRRGSDAFRGPEGSSREIPGFHAVVSAPLWGRGLYGLLTRRRSIRYFLARTWGSDNVDEDMVAYDYITSHQPGAEHAPFAFLSGRLFSKDIRTLYEALQQPVWVPHGIRGDFKDFSEAAWTESRSNWRMTAFDTGALPHFERPEPFFDGLDRFLDEPV